MVPQSTVITIVRTQIVYRRYLPSRIYTEEGQYLRITVTGSPLYHIWKDEQEQRILHDINKLCLEAFKGSYLVSEGEQKVVTITYPLA